MYSIGIDVGGTNLKAGLVDENGAILAVERVPLGAFPGEGKFRPFLSRNVADPWYTGDFTQTWLDINEGCKAILEELL